MSIAQGQAPQTDRIRKDIQGGQHGDKVAHEDPAMAPLGTDDEAAGKPPSAGERRMAAEFQAEPAASEAEKRMEPSALIVVGLIVVLAVVLYGLSQMS